MQQELQELVYHAYLDVADDACTDVRREMDTRGCTLALATAALKSRQGFHIREPHVEAIASITKRHQSECTELLNRAIWQLGVGAHESLVQLIRVRMQSVFGLMSTDSQRSV